MKEILLCPKQADYVKKMAIERIVRLGGDGEKATKIADQYFKKQIGRKEWSIKTYADDLIRLMSMEARNKCTQN